jgi:PAS domain S-box-containing protein
MRARRVKLRKAEIKPQAPSEEIVLLRKQIEELEQRCVEAEDALNAIQHGAIDALVIYSDEGEKIYTIQGAETAYRLLVESINEGAATLIKDGTILYCNRRFAEMLKAPLEVIIGTSMHHYIPPEEKTLFSSLLQRGLKENCREEINLLCNDGLTVPVMISLNNFSSSGYPGVCLVATDLTEHRLAEEMTAIAELKSRTERELRRAHDALEKTNEELKAEIAEHWQTEEILQATQQILQTLVDRMPAALALIRGSDLRLQLVNPTYQAIAPGKEMVGYTLDELWHETGQDYATICRNVLDTGKLYETVDELNMIRRTPDGPLEAAYFSWSLHRVKLPGNQGWGLLNAAWETTTRKQAEIALNESRRKYQDLIETTSDFIWEVDNQGRYTYCSPQMETLWGLKPASMVGKSPFDVMPPEERDLASKAFKEMASSAVPFRGLTSTAYNSQGDLIHIEISANPYFDSNGTFLGYRGISRDITERKQAEEKLRKAYEELEQRVRDRTRQLVIVNEDLKAEIIERERAEKNALSNAQLAESLAKSTMALSSSLQLKDVLKSLLEHVRQVVPFQGADILLLDKNKFYVASYQGFEDYPDSLAAMGKNYVIDDFPLLLKVYSTRQPLLVIDTLEDPDWRLSPGLEWVRSFLATPLTSEGKVIGIINLTSDMPGAFNLATVTRLMAFAAPATLAVKNAQLYAAESRARQVAEAMSAMSLALTRTLDLDTVLHTMLEYLPGLVSYDGAYILSLEEPSLLRLRVTDGFHEESNPKRKAGATINLWEVPYIYEVISSQRSLLIRDTHDYPGWKSLIARKEIRNWMGIPILHGDKAIGVLGLVHTKPDIFDEHQLRFVESVASQVSVAIQHAWLFDQVRTGQERAQLLSRRLVDVQESERRSIAWELHDETSQALTAIIFGLGFIEQDVNHPDKVIARVAEVKQLTDNVLDSLHRMAMNLRPASLDHLGLVTALEQLVKDAAKRYRLDMHFKSEFDSEAKRLPSHVETALYRIVQEALTNTARHSFAKNVDVILKLRDSKMVIIVEDNGVGFDTNKIRESDKLGLIGMQERAQMMGGNLQIESSPGSGTTIVVEVKYDDKDIDR